MTVTLNGRMTPRNKRPDRKMLPPVWLDKEDMAAIETLQETLWCRSLQDTFLQCLRWSYAQIQKSPTSYRRSLRESDKPFAEGVPLVLRMTDDQRKFLDEFQEAVGSETLADAIRMVIRMAYKQFV